MIKIFRGGGGLAKMVNTIFNAHFFSKKTKKKTLLSLAECSATLRVFMENFQKKSQKKSNNFFMNIFREFFGLFIFRSQFDVCLQKFGGSRPAGLAVKGIRTNSSKRLSQIII
jgi:hypothetical protein